MLKESLNSRSVRTAPDLYTRIKNSITNSMKVAEGEGTILFWSIYSPLLAGGDDAKLHLIYHLVPGSFAPDESNTAYL